MFVKRSESFSSSDLAFSPNFFRSDSGVLASSGTFSASFRPRMAGRGDLKTNSSFLSSKEANLWVSCFEGFSGSSLASLASLRQGPGVRRGLGVRDASADADR